MEQNESFLTENSHCRTEGMDDNRPCFFIETKPKANVELMKVRDGRGWSLDPRGSYPVKVTQHELGSTRLLGVLKKCVSWILKSVFMYI